MYLCVRAVAESDIDVVRSPETVTLDPPEDTVTPCGSVPVAVAVLLTAPASTSDWVTTAVPVQVSDAPGTSCDCGQVMSAAATRVSSTVMPWSVVAPVFATW